MKSYPVIFRAFNNKLGVGFQDFLFNVSTPEMWGKMKIPNFDEWHMFQMGWLKPTTNSKKNRVVVSNMFYFHPEPWRRFPFWRIFLQMGWFNHQLEKNVVFFFRETLPASTNKNPLQIDLSVLRSMIPRRGGKTRRFPGGGCEESCVFFSGWLFIS